MIHLLIKNITGCSQNPPDLWSLIFGVGICVFYCELLRFYLYFNHLIIISISFGFTAQISKKTEMIKRWATFCCS